MLFYYGHFIIILSPQLNQSVQRPGDAWGNTYLVKTEAKNILPCVFHVLFQPPHPAAGHMFADLHFADEVPVEDLFTFYISHRLKIQLSFGFFPACPGNASALLPASLAPLPPSVHIFFVFRLNDVLSFQPSWLPVTPARLPA